MSPVTAPPLVRAPRGTEISCRGWQQEAALRMLMNNLDPEVAERPQDLVVYGGSGKAAKPDMMAAAKKCGLNPPTHDAADAFGVWVLMMRAYARQYQHQWDQRLYGGRGLL